MTVNNISNALSLETKYVYRANGGNLGDFVISSAEHDFLEKNRINYEQLTKDNVNDILSKPFDLIFGGGGGWVSLYMNHCKIAKKYFLNENLKSCVVFPSTFYDVDDIVGMFDERFVVFCRDNQSLAYCKSINNRATFLFDDDIAFSLDLKKYKYDSLRHIKENKVKNAVKKAHDAFKGMTDFSKGFFIRNDVEKHNVGVIDTKNNVDISDLCGLIGERLDKTLAKEGTELFLYLIDKFEHVITNRLHVGIAALLLGKHVTLCDNSYGKIGAVYESSIRNRFENVSFVEQII